MIFALSHYLAGERVGGLLTEQSLARRLSIEGRFSPVAGAHLFDEEIQGSTTKCT
jgi:hypothetical protein